MLLLGAAVAHAPLRGAHNRASYDTPIRDGGPKRRHDPPGRSGTERRERAMTEAARGLCHALRGGRPGPGNFRGRRGSPRKGDPPQWREPHGRRGGEGLVAGVRSVGVGWPVVARRARRDDETNTGPRGVCPSALHSLRGVGGDPADAGAVSAQPGAGGGRRGRPSSRPTWGSPRRSSSPLSRTSSSACRPRGRPRVRLPPVAISQNAPSTHSSE